MLWGLLIIVVDVRAQPIDFIPDSIGYLLIYWALSSLASVQSSFAKARPFALAMSVISLADLVNYDPDSIFTLLSIIVNVPLFWLICTGIAVLATTAGTNKLARDAINVRTLYVISALMQILAIVLAPIAPGLIQVYTVPLVLFVLVVIFFIMRMLHRAALELATYSQMVSSMSSQPISGPSRRPIPVREGFLVIVAMLIGLAAYVSFNRSYLGCVDISAQPDQGGNKR
jgi:hypothetical protein